MFIVNYCFLFSHVQRGRSLWDSYGSRSNIISVHFLEDFCWVLPEFLKIIWYGGIVVLYLVIYGKFNFLLRIYHFALRNLIRTCIFLVSDASCPIPISAMYREEVDLSFYSQAGRKCPSSPKTGCPRSGAGISGPEGAWHVSGARYRAPGRRGRDRQPVGPPAGVAGAGNFRPSFRTLIADKDCPIWRIFEPTWTKPGHGGE